MERSSPVPLAWSVAELLDSLTIKWWCTTLSWWIMAAWPGGYSRAIGSSASSSSAEALRAKRAAAAAAAMVEVEAEFEANRPVDPDTPAARPWKFSNVSIHTIEHIEPPNVLTSRETLERLGWRLRLAGATPDTLEQMTGIKPRRMWDKGTTGVQAATWACRKAIEVSGVDPNRIGIICNTSVWRDNLEPSMAVCVHHELGLSASCLNLDITNACVGMVNGMLTVASMIDSGVCDYALVVNAEVAEEMYEATMDRMCRTLNVEEFRMQLATLTLGCGAVAAILCRSDLAPPGRNHRLTGAVMRCAPYGNTMCYGRFNWMRTDPRLVTHGSMVLKQTWEAAKRDLGWTSDNIDVVCPHQVSKKVHRLGAASCGVELSKLLVTYTHTGNVGPASVGIALSMSEKAGLLKEGQRLALVAFGSGINCIMANIEW